MEGSKIKTIVIVILLLLNVFLLVLSVGRRLADARSRDQARTTAIEVIRSNGIALDEAIVPKQMEHRSVQAVRDMERESELASRLLGEDVVREHRGGEAYRYRNDMGSVQFHSTGEVTAVFEKGVYPLEQSGPARHATSVAALLDCEVLVTEETVTSNGTGTVTMVQTLDGTKVVDCVLSASYRNGELTRLSGLRLLDRADKLKDGETITVSTAMMRLYSGLKQMGDIYSRIETIVPVYALELMSVGTVRLTPMWAVHTDTGDYMLNTVTGKLSRMNGLNVITE